MLTAADFVDIALEAAEEPFWLGADGEDAYRFVSTIGLARGMLQGLDEADRTQALGALRATMGSHETADGVVFGSAAWVISARCSV